MFLEILNLIIRTVFSYIFLLIVLKIMGKRELSKLSIFDAIIFLIISELFSFSLNNQNQSLLFFVVPVIVILLLELLSSYLSLKSRKMQKILEGTTSYLIYKGKILYDEMRRHNYNIEDLMLQLRNKNVQSPIEVEYAILEGNGNLNVITKKELIVKYPEPVIIDGNINYEILKRYDISEEEIYIDLAKKGFFSPEEIFFMQYLIDDIYIITFEDVVDG